DSSLGPLPVTTFALGWTHLDLIIDDCRCRLCGAEAKQLVVRNMAGKTKGLLLASGIELQDPHQ
ncbi:MAG: hypothetical protein ACM359_17705, partial [Bacillota bacterium]